MDTNACFELQLEEVKIEEKDDHSKLMKVYEKIHQKIDTLIEKRKSLIPNKE